VACGVWQAKHLRWRHWGATTARATGIVMVHTGDSCAGGLEPFHATFRFFRPRSHCRLAAAPGRETKPGRQRALPRVDSGIAHRDGTWHTTPDEAGYCRPRQQRLTLG